MDPIFPITSNTHKNVSPLSKKQPLLLGEELQDSKVILKPITNHSMKSPLNSSQVFNPYVSDQVLQWTAKTAKARNGAHHHLPAPTQEIKATCQGHKRDIQNMADLFSNTTHDS